MAFEISLYQAVKGRMFTPAELADFKSYFAQWAKQDEADEADKIRYHTWGSGKRELLVRIGYEIMNWQLGADDMGNVEWYACYDGEWKSIGLLFQACMHPFDPYRSEEYAIMALSKAGEWTMDYRQGLGYRAELFPPGDNAIQTTYFEKFCQAACAAIKAYLDRVDAIRILRSPLSNNARWDDI